MQRIPFPPDVNPDPDARFSRNTRYRPAADEVPPPPIGVFLLVCAAAVVLALLSGCTGADAQEQPSAARLYAQQEQRQAIAAVKACGLGKTAVWADAATVQCLREVTP